MKKVLLLLLVICIVTGLPTGVLAQGKPVQLSLFHPLQVFPEDEAIHGLRLNIIYGVNSEVWGADLGLVNKLTGDMKGWQYGAVNLVDGECWGLQE